MAIENFTESDVARQADLMVLDFLKTCNCKQAFECLAAKTTTAPPSDVASELFSLDMAKKKHALMAADPAKGPHARNTQRQNSKTVELPLLLHLVRSCELLKAPSGDILSPTSSTCSSPGDSGGSSSESEEVWTKSDISCLKKAIKATSGITDKTERWKTIALDVGKSKKQCYLKYKQLRAEKKQPSKKLAKDFEDGAREDGPNGTSKPSKSRRRLTSDSSAPEEQKTSITSSTIPIKQPAESISVPTATSPTGSTTEKNQQGRNTTRDEMMMLEEVEDSLGSSSSFGVVQRPTVGSSSVSSSVAQPSASTRNKGSPLSKTQRDAIQAILLPSDKKNVSSHWDQQGLFFSTNANLKYGLVQHEGGPCGVLAVVQAFVLRFLLAEDQLSSASSWQNPTKAQQEGALMAALVHILWQASNKRQASLLTNNSTISKRGFLEDAVVFTATSQQELRGLVAANLQQLMEPKGNGLVLFVASVVLSRGVDTIKNDMDSSCEVLIGTHDYCTQEMVNLLLTGQASTNVFNGNQRLEDGGGKDVLVLKGIASQATIGFLSLFEAYDHLVVGTHLKSPLLNIWVICSESHYSVLFADPSMIRDPFLDKMNSFDLFYHDGLANQNEVIRLTIHPQELEQKTKPKHDDLVPPLNLVIQTRWPLGTINWNGVDPLL